jgi:UDP-N-acetylmuramoylalanine--D-glutamate ligase
MNQAANTVSTQKNPGRAVIVGLGVTGLSCVRYLDSRGVSLTVMDSRAEPPYLDTLSRVYPHVELHAGSFDTAVAKDTDLLVMSPGVALTEPVVLEAINAGVEVVGDIELFARGRTAPVIAITGSNGKSTVTTLIGRLAEAADRNVLVGGNIGRPALELLTEPEPDCYVLELSSFQLETTSTLNPHCAVILNIAEDHMDRYQSVKDYARAKARISQGAAVVITRRHDSIHELLNLESDTQHITFGLDRPAGLKDYGLATDEDGPWLVRGSDYLVSVAELELSGTHNVANALAALASTEALFGATSASGLEALRGFQGLPHRCEVIDDRDDIIWVNDSKGTNPAATVAALEGMNRPVVLIAGGQSKGADFSILADAVRRYARQVVLFGEDRNKVAAAIGRCVPLTIADDLAHAVSLAASWAQPGDAVVLSPACASFDMFEDYQQRGEAFRQLVKEQLW